MSSILTNASALSALQSLSQTQSALKTTENQVSTGLAVSTAADNASYWSIATQLNADSGVVTAANSALSQSQSVLSTASSAICSVVTHDRAIETALTQATNPGADLSNIETTLLRLGSQLERRVNGASFNGLNVLDGSQLATGTTAATLAFVSGFNATADRRHRQHDHPHHPGADRTHRRHEREQRRHGRHRHSRRRTSPPSPRHRHRRDLLTIGTAFRPLTALGAAAGATAAATAWPTPICGRRHGAEQPDELRRADRRDPGPMTAASTFNSALTTNYATGVSALVDADMNTASTRLQALQTQEQLGIQSLSIANQNAQLILKLFPLADRDRATAPATSTPAPAPLKTQRAPQARCGRAAFARSIDRTARRNASAPVRRAPG